MCDENSGVLAGGELLLRAKCRLFIGNLCLPERLMEEEKCRAMGGCSLELPSFGFCLVM